MVLISSQTASASASLAFESGIDTTYDEYVIYFVNYHPSYNGARMGFQVNASGQTGYNENMTTTFLNSHHSEADDAASLDYQTAEDQANGTAVQYITRETGNDDDQSASGELHLFAFGADEEIKNWYARTQNNYHVDYSMDNIVAGYINTESPITQIRFSTESGNIDSGTFYLYGIK